MRLVVPVDRDRQGLAEADRAKGALERVRLVWEPVAGDYRWLANRRDRDVGEIDRAVVREAQERQWIVVIVEAEAGLSFVVSTVDLDLGKSPSVAVLRESCDRGDEQGQH
jgi:hypothetical protein